LIKKAYNRVLKPWLQIEWIFSLTENGKQMCLAHKNVLDFIYSVNFLYIYNIKFIVASDKNKNQKFFNAS